ncbi:MAG TPA: NHL repeat-containing protein [Bacteroidota bacterium]
MAALFAIAVFCCVNAGISRPADTLFLAETSFGSFEQATRITVGPQGWVYIIDGKKNAIDIFKSPQDPPTVLGGYGWTSVAFDKPTGVATDGLNIYVSDYGNHRIQRFDRYSTLLSSLSTRDTTYAPARFGYPAGVALSNLGELIILDGENLRIVEFGADSRFERTFADLNAAGGKLQNPIKVCSQGDQYIYVLEDDRILEFDFYGNYVRTIGGFTDKVVGGQSTATGIVAVCADTLFWFSSDGSLNSKTPAASLIAEEPVSDVQDLAFYDNRMFVLTPRRCTIFRIQSVAH